MALLFCDGFDHYNTGALAIAGKYTGHNNTNYQVGFTTGRFGGGAIYGGGLRGLYKLLPSNYTTLFFGLAVNFQTTFGNTGSNGFFTFTDGGTGGPQVTFSANTSGQVVIYRGLIGGSLLATSTSRVFSVGAWAYVEGKATFNGSTGSVVVKVNGVEVINQTGLDTTNTANDQANGFVVGGNHGSELGPHYFDDLYVCDTSGSYNTNFLGDIRVDTIYPTGAGNTTQWTRGGTDSGANWSQVDETPWNSDTDYNSEATATEKDTYAFGSLASASGTIKGVQIGVVARKDDAGSRSITPVYRPSSTDYDGTTQSISDSYVYYGQISEVSPATSSGWTISEVNGAEFGVKLVS